MSYQGPTCTSCGGQGGHAETTPKPDGGHTTVWRPCIGCAGRGHA
jgi:DnaJ-class molecular chaperone